MELPRSSSDIAIATACLACNGNGGFGIRRETLVPNAGSSRFDACSSCEGTGWIRKPPYDLTAPQLQGLRRQLATCQPDPPAPVAATDPIDTLGKLLAKQWIESVGFPKGDASEIELTDKKGNVIRLLPEFKSGHFTNFNAIPIPPAP